MPRQTTARIRAVTTCLAILAAMPGCGVMQRMTGEAARREAGAEEAKAQSQALQQKVMRFADQYVERVVRTTEVLATTLGDEAQVAIYDWQFTQATAAVQVAAGPNPVTNAIDMVVLVSLNRRIVEARWLDRYGEGARAVVQAYVALEQEAWALLDEIGTSGQRAEFETALTAWLAANPGLETAAYIRFADFAAAGTQAEVRVSPGLLGIVGLDPLKGIDPAVREFEQTRILAERAVYYAQRLPTLLDIQLRLMSVRLSSTPESRQVFATMDQVRRLSDSLERLASQAPGLIASEREAAIAQFMAELGAQNEAMLTLTTQLKGALEAGTITAQSLDALVQSTDALVARFAPDADAATAQQPGRPFDINDYTRTIAELAGTARELQVLVRDVDALTPELASRFGQLSGEARAVVDYAFVRVLLAILALLVAAILYRLVTVRIMRAQ